MDFFNIALTREYEQMVSFCRPLADHFGINHFWHYYITKNGDYGFVGTHTKWCEYCFENNLLVHFPMLRHPALVDNGITFMKNYQDPVYQEVLNTAKDKFKISFNLNIVEKTANGMAAYGFGSKISDPMQDQRFINELPLIRYFIKTFKLKHHKLIELTQQEPINLANHLGEKFYQRSSCISMPTDKEVLLRKIGLGWILCLTPRERDILALLPSCILCQEVAQKLSLSIRTVENYIATLKQKLNCPTKLELIQKAKIFVDLEI